MTIEHPSDDTIECPWCETENPAHYYQCGACYESLRG